MRIVDRILELLEERNISARQMLIDLDLATSSMNDWKSGRSNPSTAAISKIANYFGVSTDYLINGCDFANSYGYSSDTPDELKDWIALYDKLNSLPKDKRSQITAYLTGYVDAMLRDKS